MNYKTKKIQEVAELNNSTIDRKSPPAYIRYLETGSITRNHVDGYNHLYAEKDKYPSRAQRTVRNKTIIYSTVRPNKEHFGILEHPYDNLVVSTGFTTIDTKEDELLPEYLFYYLTREDVTRHLQRIAELGVTSYPSITPEDIGTLEIQYPVSKKNQKEIINPLINIDRKIYLNREINGVLVDIVMLLFEQWFLQFNFPDKDGRPYKASGGKMKASNLSDRKIPDGWCIGKLKDFIDFNPSLTLDNNKLSSYIDMEAIPEEGFMTDVVQKKKYNGGVKFQNGDVIVARITPCLENGKTGLVSLLDKNEVGFGSTEFIVMRGREKKLSGFISCLSRSNYFRKYAISKMTGTSGRKRIDYTSLEQMKIAYPKENLNLMNEFENLVAPFFEKMASNSHETHKLLSIRNWIHPLLFNGQMTAIS